MNTEKRRCIPVEVAARLMHKSPRFVQEGLKSGALPFGYAVKMSRWSFYINAEKFTTETGIEVPEELMEDHKKC